MTTIPGYYTPQEIMSLFSWKRAQLSTTAKHERWTRYKVGNTYLYDKGPIDEYQEARQRTELMRQAGYNLAPGLVHHDNYDVLGGCPECHHLAVEMPDGEGWACVKGHKGK